MALSEVRSEKPLPQNGGGDVEGEEPPPAQDDDRPRQEKSVLQGKLTKLAIQIGYGGWFFGAVYVITSQCPVFLIVVGCHGYTFSCFPD